MVGPRSTASVSNPRAANPPAATRARQSVRYGIAVAILAVAAVAGTQIYLSREKGEDGETAVVTAQR